MRPHALLLLAACSASTLADVTSMTAGEMEARDEALARVKAAASGPAHPDDVEEEAAAMKEWQEATAPRSEHRRLAALAGTWDVEVTSWTEAGGEPAIALGTVTAKMMLGGRWLRRRKK